METKLIGRMIQWLRSYFKETVILALMAALVYMARQNSKLQDRIDENNARAIQYERERADRIEEIIFKLIKSE